VRVTRVERRGAAFSAFSSSINLAIAFTWGGARGV
jgi:hypothetical protein